MTHSPLAPILSDESLRYNMNSVRNRFLLLLSVGLTVLLTGCDDLSNRLHQAGDSRSIPGMFVYLLISVFAISYFASSRGEPTTKHLHNALKWGGWVTVAVSPAYCVSTHALEAGGATALTGALAIVLSLTVLKDWAGKKQN